MILPLWFKENLCLKDCSNLCTCWLSSELPCSSSAPKSCPNSAKESERVSAASRQRRNLRRQSQPPQYRSPLTITALLRSKSWLLDRKTGSCFCSDCCCRVQ